MLFLHLKSVIAFCFLTFCTSAFCQSKIIEIKYEKDREGTGYVFECVNNSFANYSVEVTFSTLLNLNADVGLPFKGTVKPGTNRLFNLKPTGISGNASFNFTYT